MTPMSIIEGGTEGSIAGIIIEGTIIEETTITRIAAMRIRARSVVSISIF